MQYLQIFISNMKNENKLISTHVLKSLVLLLQLSVDLHEGLLGLVKFILDGLDLLLQGTGLLFGLI